MQMQVQTEVQPQMQVQAQTQVQRMGRLQACHSLFQLQKTRIIKQFIGYIGK